MRFPDAKVDSESERLVVRDSGIVVYETTFFSLVIFESASEERTSNSINLANKVRNMFGVFRLNSNVQLM